MTKYNSQKLEEISRNNYYDRLRINNIVLNEINEKLNDIGNDLQYYYNTQDNIMNQYDMLPFHLRNYENFKKIYYSYFDKIYELEHEQDKLISLRNDIIKNN